MNILRLPACNFLSQYYFYNIFLQKSCMFSLQTLAKFEVTKTGSGVGFLRLTAVCFSPHCSICTVTLFSALGTGYKYTFSGIGFSTEIRKLRSYKRTGSSASSYHKSHNGKDKTCSANRSGEQRSFVVVVEHFEIFASAICKGYYHSK